MNPIDTYIDMNALFNLDPEIEIKITGSGFLERIEEVNGIRLKIEVAPFSVNGNILRVYEALSNLYARYSYRLLIDYVYATPYEYLLLLLDSGRAVVLQGFERKVVYPSKREILFSSHTHPRAYAVLSRRDLYSALDLLSKRGFAACVVGIDGELCIYRKLLISEEDYEQLMVFANENDALDLNKANRLGLTSVGFLKI